MVRNILLLLLLQFTLNTNAANWTQVKTGSVDLYLLKTTNTLNQDFSYYKDLAVGAYVYVPKNKIKKVVFITPTISGLSPIEKTNAKYFAKKGYAVIVPMPFKSEIDNLDPDVYNLDREFILPAQNAAIILQDFKSKFQLGDDLAVFAMGASQGGFRSLVIAARTPNIRAAWIVTAGGDFASIYAQSKVGKVEAYKNRVKDKLGIYDDSEYEELLRKTLTNDPSNLCKEIKIPFTQTIALKDDKVPTGNQLLLSENCSAHDVLKLNVGHVQASLSTSYYLSKIEKYFEQFK